MSETRPVACTLKPSDLQHRGAAWRKLWATGLLDRRRVPGGIRLSAGAGAEATLLQLIDLERECCPWIDYAVDGGTVTLTAEGDGESVLAGMFLP